MRNKEWVKEFKGGAWLSNHGKTEDNPEAKGIGFLIHPFIIQSGIYHNEWATNR